MSNRIYKKVLMSLTIVCAIFSAYGMNKEKIEEKFKTFDEWIYYIQEHAKEFNPYYFYGKGSLKLLQNICAVDKDKNELSSDTLDVIRVFCRKCRPKFDKLRVNSSEILDEGIHVILYNQLINQKKQLQIFTELLDGVKDIGRIEYFYWFVQAIYMRNARMICFLLDDRFECFLKEETFFDSVVSTAKVFFSRGNVSNKEQVVSFHCFFETIERFLNINLAREEQTMEKSKEDTRQFNFLNKQKKYLYDFLDSKKGRFCFALACAEKYWDYIDYCLERPNNKIGINNEWDILIFILNIDTLSPEEKYILLRHIISRAREQGTQKILFAHDNYSFFGCN